MVAGFDFGPGFDGGVSHLLAARKKRGKKPIHGWQTGIAVIAAIGIALFGLWFRQ